MGNLETPEGTGTPETPETPEGGTPAPTGTGEGAGPPAEQQGEGTGDPDTFPRTYVEELRTESAGHRTRATALEREVFDLRVAALGALQDPTDLPYDPKLDTPEAVAEAVEALTTKKPHLKARKVGGDIGQHQQGAEPKLGLGGMLRRGA